MEQILRGQVRQILKARAQLKENQTQTLLGNSRAGTTLILQEATVYYILMSEYVHCFYDQTKCILSLMCCALAGQLVLH